MNAERARNSGGAPIPKARLLIYCLGWDASSGMFPANAAVGDVYSVTNGGVVDGATFGIGDQVFAKSTNAATAADWTRVPAILPALEFTTVADLLASTQGLVPGRTVMVAQGQLFFEVAALAAADHHVVTAGGSKLYALPDRRGAVTASQIGIPENDNGTAAFTQFLGSRLTGISRLICDVDFNLASSSHSGFSAPKTITLEADNADEIGHGDAATRTIGLMNLITQRADANGLNRYGAMFDANSFRAVGLRFAYDQEVTEQDIINAGGGNGNGNAVFSGAGGSGFFAEKCKADFISGFFLQLDDHAYWRVSDCWAGKNYFFTVLTGRCDYGLFERNSGHMGYRTNNLFGDYIKVSNSSTNGLGSRFCRVVGNRFINDLRDGIDSTGGLHGWQIIDNYFKCAIGAIDAKQQPKDAGSINDLEENYKGLTISNNVIHGCEIIITANIDVSAWGSTPPDWFLVHGITASGNVFVPRPGKEQCGYYFKGGRGLSVTGDNFTAYRLRKAGDFDPTTGAFPSAAVEGTYYEATTTGTIDGMSITVGDFIVPQYDNAPTDDSSDWRVRNTAWISCSMLRFDGGEASGYSNQGSWDASSGSFPTSTTLGQYWTVGAAGKVDGITFNVGEKLVALVNGASTTAYDGNWERHRIDFCLTPGRDISFKNVLWDARGEGGSCTVSECERVSLHFAELKTDKSQTLFVGGKAHEVSISGVLNAYPDEFAPTNSVDPIYIESNSDIRIDLDATYHGSVGKGDCVRHVTGSPTIWMDGTYRNWLRTFRTLDPLKALYLGCGRGMTVRECIKIMLRTSEAHKVIKGTLHSDLPHAEYIGGGTTALTGNLFSLEAGQGEELSIAGGVVTAVNGFHVIDTQGDAATDDLTTIEGGQTGDELSISCAASARVITAKDGIGNLVLGADRVFDAPGDTLVLRRCADGKWHQVDFYDAA